MITENQIKSIVEQIAQVEQPEKIVLFGSYAVGNPTECSDLDLLIVKQSSDQRHMRTRTIRRVLRGCKIPLDIVIYTPDEIEAWKNVETAFITRVLREGKVVYGK